MIYLLFGSAISAFIASIGGIIISLSKKTYPLLILFSLIALFSLFISISLLKQIFQIKNRKFRDRRRSTFDAALAIEHFGGTAYKDPISGLVDSEVFGIFLENRCAHAKRTLKPLSLALIRITSAANLSPQETAYQLSVLGEVLNSTLRDSDIAFRRGENDIALLFEDTAEAGALWACERIQSVLLKSPLKEVVVISAGVATYPSHALNEKELINQTETALNKAVSQENSTIVIAKPNFEN